MADKGNLFSFKDSGCCHTHFVYLNTLCVQQICCLRIMDNVSILNYYIIMFAVHWISNKQGWYILSPLVANMYIFEDLAVEICIVKAKFWLRYVDDTFIIWNGRNRDLEESLHQMNHIRLKIKLTMKEKAQETIPYLDVKWTRKNNHIKHIKHVYTLVST